MFYRWWLKMYKQFCNWLFMLREPTILLQSFVIQLPCRPVKREFLVLTLRTCAAAVPHHRECSIFYSVRQLNLKNASLECLCLDRSLITGLLCWCRVGWVNIMNERTLTRPHPTLRKSLARRLCRQAYISDQQKAIKNVMVCLVFWKLVPHRI